MTRCLEVGQLVMPVGQLFVSTASIDIMVTELRHLVPPEPELCMFTQNSSSRTHCHSISPHWQRLGGAGVGHTSAADGWSSPVLGLDSLSEPGHVRFSCPAKHWRSNNEWCRRVELEFPRQHPPVVSVCCGLWMGCHVQPRRHNGTPPPTRAACIVGIDPGYWIRTDRVHDQWPCTLGRHPP